MTTSNKVVKDVASTKRKRKRKVKDKPKSGILYVLLFELEGKQLVKIGITSRKMEDRVLEIIEAIFQKYRVFPMCNPRRFTRTEDYAAKERQLHKMFKEYSFKPSKKFGGYTEFFDVPVDKVVEAYDELVKRAPAKKKGVFFSRTETV